MNTLKRLLLSLSIVSMGFVAHVRADDSTVAAVADNSGGAVATTDQTAAVDTSTDTAVTSPDSSSDTTTTTPSTDSTAQDSSTPDETISIQVSVVESDDSYETEAEADAAIAQEDMAQLAQDIIADTETVMSDINALAQQLAQNAAAQGAVAEGNAQSLVAKYQNMAIRTLAKSVADVVIGNYMGELPVPQLLQGQGADGKSPNGTLAKIYPDLTKIVAHAAIDELLPQNADADTIQHVVETLVPLTAAQFIGHDSTKDKHLRIAFAIALTQKILSKGLFIKTDGLKQRAIQIAEFVLSCIDAKELNETADLTNYIKYISVHKGVAKLVTRQVMEALVKQSVSDAQVTSKSTREKAIADFFQAVLVKPLCEAGAKIAFAK